MSTTRSQRDRRNAVIRFVAAITGDIAVGLAMASLCSWIIQSAALGLFLSFLLWLIAALLSLALSQYLVHPGIKFLLSDHKLDMAVDTAGDLCSTLTVLGQQTGRQVWSAARRGLGGLGGFAGFKDRTQPT